MRQATRLVRADVLKLIRDEIDSQAMNLTPALADKVGLMVQAAIQRRIVALRDPTERA